MPVTTSTIAPVLFEKSLPVFDSAFQTPQESPSRSPALTHVNRRMKLKPVRGPESATDKRFEGIAFSLHADPRQSQKAAAFGAVILREFDLCPEIERETIALLSTAASTRSPMISAPSSPMLACGDDSDSDIEIDMAPEPEYINEISLELQRPTPIKAEVRRKAIPKPARVPVAHHQPHHHNHHNTAPAMPALDMPIAKTSSGSVRKPKSCACCGCTSTPLWRDMGKHRPLCNACGIRWKKYGVMCESCQYVPCKQERDSRTCRRCLVLLPPSVKRVRPNTPEA